MRIDLHGSSNERSSGRLVTGVTMSEAMSPTAIPAASQRHAVTRHESEHVERLRAECLARPAA
jgi:hypothetical protein